jgi:DNA replication protein DnaC
MTCQDRGYSLVPVNSEFPRCPDCDRREQVERLQALQSLSSLNDAERQITLADIALTSGPTDDMVAAARSFLINPRNMLTLWGGSGNAKTTILQAVVNECWLVGISAIYITLYDLAGYVREAINKENQSTWRRVRRFQSVRVLCIDEFDPGKVKETEWLRELESAIIDQRYRDGLAGTVGTLIAMNSNPAELPYWIYSRLSDGRNRIIRNTDPDVRPMMRDTAT